MESDLLSKMFCFVQNTYMMDKSTNPILRCAISELVITENQVCSELYGPEQRDSQSLQNTGKPAHINTVSSPTNENTKPTPIR
jgi:hypothetical protein